MNPAARGSDVNAVGGTLYRAPELSNRTWKVVFGDGVKRHHVSVDAGDLVKLREGVAKERFRLPSDARVVSCYGETPNLPPDLGRSSVLPTKSP